MLGQGVAMSSMQMRLYYPVSLVVCNRYTFSIVTIWFEMCLIRLQQVLVYPPIGGRLRLLRRYADAQCLRL
jgi:hypothetical protein